MQNSRQSIQDIPFRIQGQQIQKSIVYQIPNNRVTQSNLKFYEPSNALTKTYKVQKETKNHIGSKDGVMCLNCNNYVRLEEVDQHSLSHLKIV